MANGAAARPAAAGKGPGEDVANGAAGRREEKEAKRGERGLREKGTGVKKQRI